MIKKNKKKTFIKRLIIWTLYLFSGYILYFKQGYISYFLLAFSKMIYPLSIFWVQIRIKKRDKFFPINSSMSTSQLWFLILPLLGSVLRVIFSISNAFLFHLINVFQY